MKSLPVAILSFFVLSSPVLGCAQQSAVKPVLAADPVVPPPIVPPAQAIAVPASPIALDPSYIIGPDDMVHVNVFEENELSGDMLVRPDGMISITLIGDIQAAGRTPTDLAKAITAEVGKLKKDPTVTVTVTQIRSKTIYLVGEVGRVGPLSITPGMSILQAFASAGGLTAYANKKHIYILRGLPGKQQKIPFDYTKALKSGNMQGISLVPGDTIVVP